MKRYLSFAILFFVLPSAIRAQQQPAPDLSLTVNDSQSINLYQGWPLIVHATIMNSQRLSSGSANSPLIIAPTGAPWTSAIQFTAVSSSGKTFQWPLQLVGTPDTDSLTLSQTSYVRIFWQISPTDVAAIPADSYQLTATLHVANSSGWNGLVQSRAATIIVGPEPALTPEQQSEKVFLTIEYFRNAEDLNSALDAAQKNAVAQPADANAIGAVASLLESGGYPQLAFFRANDALAAYFQADPTPVEAPYNLLTMYQRLFSLMLSDGSGPVLTSVAGSSQTVTFSPVAQTVTLSAMVSDASGQVDGGTVTFIVNGVGNPVTSQPVVNDAASTTLTIPSSTAAGNYSIQAVYTGTAAFSPSADSSQSLTISKATPTLAWNVPSSIPSGTALDSSQLNATASVPGTFVYNPPAGTILPSGTTQTLSVTFTPTDSTDYNSATASIPVTILSGNYSGSVSPTSATIPVGSSQTFNITVNSSTFNGTVSLTCANPPAGITCHFTPSQLSLSPSAPSSTMLTVSVSAKPAVLVPQPPANNIKQLPSPRVILMLLTIAVLSIVLSLTSRDLRRGMFISGPPTLARLGLALLLFAAFQIAACTSASLTGQGPSKNGSGGGSIAPANVTLVIQGTSGANIVNVNTLSITVP